MYCAKFIGGTFKVCEANVECCTNSTYLIRAENDPKAKYFNVNAESMTLSFKDRRWISRDPGTEIKQTIMRRCQLTSCF